MSYNYCAYGSDTNTDNTSILSLEGATTIRPEIYDIIIGSRATPADYACGFEFQRFTVAGAGTTVTPAALKPGDPAAKSTVLQALSSEPTYTASAYLLYFALNQRATFRWVAAPKSGLKIPATSGNGIGLQCDTPSTAFVNEACIHFEE